MNSKKHISECKRFLGEMDRPQDDDIFIQPEGRLGAQSAAYSGGKLIAGPTNDYRKLERDIQKWMQRNGWFPNVWNVDDHGGIELYQFENSNKKRANVTEKTPSTYYVDMDDNWIVSDIAQAAANAERAVTTGMQRGVKHALVKFQKMSLNNQDDKVAYATKVSDVINDLQTELFGVMTRFNQNIMTVGVLLTFVEKRAALSRQIQRQMREFFGDIVFDTVIHRNTRLAEAPSAGESIFTYDPKGKGAAEYRGLAEEITSKKIPSEQVSLQQLAEKVAVEAGDRCD